MWAIEYLLPIFKDIYMDLDNSDLQIYKGPLLFRVIDKV